VQRVQLVPFFAWIAIVAHRAYAGDAAHAAVESQDAVA
jgi:hypothetical protein